MSGAGNEDEDPAAAERIRSRIAAISEVSALPLSLQKIMAALSRDDLTISVLDEVIRHDQSLAAKIVSVANSAFYYVHRGVHVNSLDQAILVLGSNTIRDIALGISIFKIFPVPYRTLKQMWAHAYRVALASGYLASRIDHSDREVSFLAGLLHDIGKVVLLSVAEPEEIRMSGNEAGTIITSREEEAFHCTHMQAGYWFLKGIDLPDEIALPVLYHHKYIEGTEHPLIVAPVFIAEALVGMLSEDVLADGEWTDTTAALASNFNIDQTVLAECLQLINMEADFIDSYFE